MRRHLFASTLATVLLATSVSFAAKSKRVEPVMPMPYPVWRLTAKEGKANVCSITINSSEEIEMFKDRLGPENFNFIELTTLKSQSKNETQEGPEGAEQSSGNGPDWLRYACKQQIKCDVLVISGHFGGTFFGSSGLNLSMEELERSSCDSSCDGILQNPKEVFLFGCNTLAGKSRDARSPEEYRRVLLEDGFTTEQAEQVVAFRYSPIGDSFFDRMRRVFRGAPRIYGFDSIAPSGKSIEKFLGQYFSSQSGSYYFPENLRTLDEALNKNLARALQWTAFAQTSGARGLTREQVPVCYLNNPKVPFFHKLHWVEKSLSSDKSFAYLPAINEWLSQLKRDGHRWRDKEFEVLEAVMRNKQLRDSLEAIVKKPDMAILGMQLKIMNFMKFFGWIYPKDFMNRLKDFLIGDLSVDFDVERKDQICSYAQSNSLKVDIDPEQIPNARFKDSEFIDVLQCLASYNRKLVLRALSEMKSAPEQGSLRSDYVALIRGMKIPKDDYPTFFHTLFPNGDRKLTNSEKDMLCGYSRLAQWDFGGLDKSLLNSLEYVESVGCYHAPTSNVIADLAKVARQPNMRKAVAESLGKMFSRTEKYSLSEEDQVALFEITEMMQTTDELYEVSQIWKSLDEMKTPLVERMISRMQRLPESKSQTIAMYRLQDVLASLSKGLFCARALDLVEESLNLKNGKAALPIAVGYADHCGTNNPETDKFEFPVHDVPRFATLLPKLLATYQSDENESAFDVSPTSLVVLIAQEKPKLTTIRQMKTLIELNQATTFEYGTATTAGELLALMDRRTLVKALAKMAKETPKGMEEFLATALAAIDIDYEPLNAQYIYKIRSYGAKAIQDANDEFQVLGAQDPVTAGQMWLESLNQFLQSEAEDPEYVITFPQMQAPMSIIWKRILPLAIDKKTFSESTIKKFMSIYAANVWSNFQNEEEIIREFGKKYPAYATQAEQTIQIIRTNSQSCTEYYCTE